MHFPEFKYFIRSSKQETKQSMRLLQSSAYFIMCLDSPGETSKINVENRFQTKNNIVHFVPQAKISATTAKYLLKINIIG